MHEDATGGLHKPLSLSHWNPLVYLLTFHFKEREKKNENKTRVSKKEKLVILIPKTHAHKMS